MAAFYVRGQKFTFRKTTFGCFDRTSVARFWIVWIVTSRAFEIMVSGSIILNVFMLSIKDYNTPDAAINKYIQGG
jgi:hypothetical protein